MSKGKTIKIIREAYGEIAKGQKGCGTCCGPDARKFAKSSA